MKTLNRLLFLIIIVNLISSCTEEKIISTHNNNNPKLVNYYRFGKNDEYVQKKFDRLGGLISITEFKNNKMHGNHVEYWDNGQVKLNKKYENGVSEGWERGFHRNGAKYSEVYLIGGEMPDGKSITWYENGEISTEYFIKDGKADGDWLVYHKNGQLQEKGYYQNDSLIGMFEVFDEQGILLSRKIYQESNFYSSNRIVDKVNIDMIYKLNEMNNIYDIIQLPNDISTSSVSRFIDLNEENKRLLSGSVTIIKYLKDRTTHFIGEVGMLVNAKPEEWKLTTRPDKITYFVTEYDQIELWNGLYIGCHEDSIDLSKMQVVKYENDTLNFIDNTELFYQVIFQDSEIKKIKVKNNR